MHAEEKKEIETNSLERWARRTWESVSQKSLFTYGFIFALVVIGILAISWWSGVRSAKKASMWTELDRLDSREKLKRFAEEHRGETSGNIARIRIARVDLGSEGLIKLGTRDQEQRKTALTNLVEGRKIYSEVAPQLKDFKSLQIEAWLGAAKAEETLIGATLPDSTESSLGNADKAIEYYEKALALLGESEEGKKLKEYVTNFKASKEKIVKNYTEFHASMKPLEPIKIETPKIETPKKEETKKEETKKEELKKEEVKKDEPKKDESKKEEPKKEDPKSPEKK